MLALSRPVPDATPLALSVQGLGKRYDIYPNDRSRFFEFLGSRTHHTEHWALREVAFDVPAGGTLGVIGNNGAGKSSLLRILSGISSPTEGGVQVHGRLSALLDLGAGFHSAFTGRENIFLGCALAGLTEAQTDERIPAILRFAELGAFIDHPVRTYSTGMQLRLGFAVAVHTDARVLLIDEVLAVGDQYFQRKCIERVQALVASGVALVLVSHDVHAVRAVCKQVCWLERGRVRELGSAREVVDAYLGVERVFAPGATAPLRSERVPAPMPLPAKALDETAIAAACAPASPLALFESASGDAPRIEDGDRLPVSGTGELRVLRVSILDEAGRVREVFRSGEGVVIAVTFRTTQPIENPILGAALFRDDGVYVFGPNTGFDQVLPGTFHGVYTYYLHLPALPLLAGNYRVSVGAYDQQHVRAYAFYDRLFPFAIAQDVDDHGLVRLPHTWGLLTWYTP